MPKKKYDPIIDTHLESWNSFNKSFELRVRYLSKVEENAEDKARLEIYWKALSMLTVDQMVDLAEWLKNKVPE